MTEEDNKNKKVENVQNKIEQLYGKIAFYETITDCLFYINIIIILSFIFQIKFKSLFIIIHIVINSAYIIITRLIDIFLKNYVETEHRKTFIKNSLNANITENTTPDLYYNNNEKESIKKMGLNCFETLFFSKFIANKMIKEEGLKTFGIILIYISLLFQIKNLAALILIISQTFFSIEYIFKFIKLYYFKTQANYIYTEVYDIFITSPPKEENVFIAKILDIIMNYECLKYFCKISLSSRIFNKYNSILSKEWDDIYNKKLN
ncbi:hypothetical protein BCR32DRAFT_271639 [Anaeromyces robustus]|uniref:Uncharacterized protein n=1 Tax=Anaeromyces robustus TaxID=1754192 RepID=A0A1Y1WRT6_9FUNG|nr:hypothetical protein BCR32DRAFT_271639 [Anaeromyces robustus]|eukprot:ORX75834.1 hypothetical protein BCR32DRAFT_271639 [Anaeromyces robustus]